MKLLKCPICKREHEVEDNVIISLCPVCLVEMKEIKRKNERQNKKTLKEIQNERK